MVSGVAAASSARTGLRPPASPNAEAMRLTVAARSLKGWGAVVVMSAIRSGGVLDRKAHERSKRALIRGVGYDGQGRQGRIAFLAGAAGRVLKSPSGFDCRHHRLQLGETPLPDRLADSLLLRFAAVPECVDKRQGRLALGEILAEVLAALVRVGTVVEYVVDELVSGAQVTAI